MGTITREHIGYRVVSDGSGRGTRLYDANGDPVDMKSVRSITWRITRGGSILVVEYVAGRGDVVGGASGKEAAPD